MLAVKSPLIHRPVPVRRKISRIVSACNTYHIMGYVSGRERGTYTGGGKIVAFKTFNDAYCYKTLLEAEVEKSFFIQFVSRFELDHICSVGNYQCQIIEENVLVFPSTMDQKL
jgi:hypothetical protein